MSQWYIISIIKNYFKGERYSEGSLSDESGELATEAHKKASDEPIEKDVDISGLATSSEVAPIPGCSYHIGGLDDEFEFGTISNSEDFLGEQSGSKATEEWISYSDRSSSDGEVGEEDFEIGWKVGDTGDLEDSEIWWKVGDTDDFINVRIEMRNIRYIWQYFIFFIQLIQVLPT